MYGLSDEDINYFRKKYFKNLHYYKSRGILNPITGEFRNFLSLSVSSPNYSIRYHSTINNRVHSMFELANDYKLVSVFITITLDSYFRDFLKGVFDFDKIHFRSIPKHLHHKIYNNDIFTIKDLVSVINYQFSSFLKSYVFKKMKKNKDFYLYIKSVEPHKRDGVPHIHALFFVKKDYIIPLKKAFYEYFPAPQKRFETSIRKPAGYIMKYIRKTFMNLHSQSEPDELQIWYMKYNIRRFTYSFCVLPFWIYKQIYFLDNICNWYLFSYEYNVLYKNYKNNEFILKNKYSDIEILLIDGILRRKINNVVVFEKDISKKKYYLVSFDKI